MYAVENVYQEIASNEFNYLSSEISFLRRELDKLRSKRFPSLVKLGLNRAITGLFNDNSSSYRDILKAYSLNVSKRRRIELWLEHSRRKSFSLGRAN